MASEREFFRVLFADARDLDDRFLVCEKPKDQIRFVICNRYWLHFNRLHYFLRVIAIPPSKKTTSAHATEAIVFVSSILNFIVISFLVCSRVTSCVLVRGELERGDVFLLDRT